MNAGRFCDAVAVFRAVGSGRYQTSCSFRIVEPTKEPLWPGLKLNPSLQSEGGQSEWGAVDSWQPLLPVVLFHQALDGTFLEISPQIEALVGMTPDTWLNEGLFWDYVHPADVGRVEAHLKRCQEVLEPRTLEFRLRLPHQHRNHWVRERRRCVTGRDGSKRFEGSWLDITAQKMAEQRLPSAAWQRALASLTPGVAHDLNNHFASILALSDGFVRRTSKDHPFHEGSQTIRDSIQQAAKLIQRLVAVHLTRTGDWKYHTMPELLNEVLDFMRHSISRRITFQIDLTSGTVPVYLDGIEFRRALIALAKNVVDAIPNPASGTLKFKTRVCTHVAGHPVDPVPENALGFLAVTVEDSGPGIPETLQDQLFEPWFSTKPPSEGTGLGLYGVRCFMQRCRGGITFQRGDLSGASFTLWFPVSDLEDASRHTSSHRQDIYLSGQSSELETAAQSLKDMGFHVIATHLNPLELLQDQDEGPAAICLLKDVAPLWIQPVSKLIRSRRWNTRILCEHSESEGPPSYPEGLKPDISLGAPFSNPRHQSRIQALLPPHN